MFMTSPFQILPTKHSSGPNPSAVTFCRNQSGNQSSLTEFFSDAETVPFSWPAVSSEKIRLDSPSDQTARSHQRKRREPAEPWAQRQSQTLNQRVGSTFMTGSTHPCLRANLMKPFLLWTWKTEIQVSWSWWRVRKPCVYCFNSF